MRNVTALLLTVAILLSAPSVVEAQPTVDGQTTDSEYLLVGTSPPEPGGSYTGGVVGLKAYAGPDSLYVAVEGKVENDTGADTPEMVVFINSASVDGVAAGTPLPTGSNSSSPFAFVDSMQMDMETDFGVRITGDAESPQAFASIADYAGYAAGDSTSDGKVKDVGDTILESLDGTPSTGDAPGRYAYDDTSDVTTVDDTGFEFAIPHDQLGTSEDDQFQFFAIYGFMPDTVSATLIPDDGEKTLYSNSEDWTAVTGKQATGAQVLPVELASFEARTDGGNAVLNWVTATEVNNAGFSVQHAVGSSNFEQVGWVDGTGTTAESQNYSFTVEDLSAGTHRFRLLQEDLDGSTTLSSVVKTKVRPKETVSIEKVAPNPVQSTATLRFTPRESGDVTVTLYDVLGRQINRLFAGRVSGGHSQRVRIDASSLSSGVYLLRVHGDGFTRTRRISVAQ